MNAPNPSRSNRAKNPSKFDTFAKVILVTLPIVTLCLHIYTREHQLKSDLILMYSFVAAFFGFFFATYTNSSGEWTQVGIKFSGAAAIGVIFLYLISNFIASVPETTCVNFKFEKFPGYISGSVVPSFDKSKLHFEGGTPSFELFKTNSQEFDVLAIEFKDGIEKFIAKVPYDSGGELKDLRLEFRRSGEINDLTE